MPLEAFECQLFPQKGELFINGSAIVLRPKTFELLFLLASNPGDVFSKAEILSMVWKNSVVEDQVIFQSINEIRKKIGCAEVIKTYPRRGYSWEVTNTMINPLKIDDLTLYSPEKIQSIEPKDKPLQQTKSKPIKQAFLVSLLVLISCIGLFFFFSNNIVFQKNIPYNNASINIAANSHTGLLVLPFNVDSLDSSQKWLRFGAMEGIIKKISPKNNITVFHLEDAIEILNRLPAHEQRNASKIFDKSGASHILATSLSGVPGEFNVIYTLYSRQSQTTKTLSAMSIDSALSQLINMFTESLSEKIALNKHDFDKQLQNDLIVKAIQFLEISDNHSALAFIESAVINDSKNIVALYFQAKIAMNLNDIEKVLEASNKALALKSNPKLPEYQHRLLYLKATALIAAKKLIQAKMYLKQAKQQAKTHKDWLYFSYSQSMLGKIEQQHKQYEQAFYHFSSALEYQELLQCPMGIVQSYIDLAELYLKKGNVEKAQLNFIHAKKLINEKKLIQAKPLLQNIEQMIDNR